MQTFLNKSTCKARAQGISRRIEAIGATAIATNHAPSGLSVRQYNGPRGEMRDKIKAAMRRHHAPLESALRVSAHQNIQRYAHVRWACQGCI